MIRHRPLIFNLKVNKGEMDLVIKFNECGSYSKAECMDGEEAEKVMPLMSTTEQYLLGLKAGKVLRKIHELTAPEDMLNWEERYFAVMDERIDEYCSSGTFLRAVML